MAIPWYSLISLLTGVLRRLIRHSLRMAISGSTCNLTDHNRMDYVPALRRIWQYSLSKFIAQIHELFLIHKMVTRHILCTLRNLYSFLLSDLLSTERPILKPSTIIVIADPHTEGGSHLIAIRFKPRSSSAYYFDAYGIIPLLPSIQTFIRHHCTT